MLNEMKTGKSPGPSSTLLELITLSVGVEIQESPRWIWNAS